MKSRLSMTAQRPVTRCISTWLLAAALATLNCIATAHDPDQAPHRIADLGAFEFENGGKLANLRMSYITYGKLNAAKSNAILVQHGFAANHHQYDHFIGAGKPLDTDKYFIIATDALGHTQTTFEHSSSPTSSGLKMKFPYYNGRDMVRAQHRLITQALGIPHLLAISGISSGADHSVQFAISYPDFMDGIFPMVGGAMWGTQGFFFGPVLISSITSCKGWDDGNYDKNPAECVTNALSALVPYFYTREWWDRHIDTPESYTKWRNAWGAYYLDVQDARDLYYRASAWGKGWVGNTPGFQDLDAALGSIKAKTLFLYSPSDQFYMPHHIEAQVKAIPGARSVAIESIAGHLICCNADPNATREIGASIQAFLTGLTSTASGERDR